MDYGNVTKKSSTIFIKAKFVLAKTAVPHR